VGQAGEGRGGFASRERQWLYPTSYLGKRERAGDVGGGVSGSAPSLAPLFRWTKRGYEIKNGVVREMSPPPPTAARVYGSHLSPLRAPVGWDRNKKRIVLPFRQFRSPTAHFGN
jgi:hypothetical protein